MSKSLQNRNFGHQASASQPGVPTPRKLRSWADSGLGREGEFQRQVNRMFRTEASERPAPHVVDVSDIFKNLGLDSLSLGKLERLVREMRHEYGTSSKDRAPRVVHARIALMDAMRAMRHIDSSTRMEILRRAQAYWRRNGAHYDADPSIRYVPMGKSMKHVMTLQKAGPYIGPKGGLWQDPKHTIPFKRSDLVEHHKADRYHHDKWAAYHQAEADRLSSHPIHRLTKKKKIADHRSKAKAAKSRSKFISDDALAPHSISLKKEGDRQMHQRDFKVGELPALRSKPKRKEAPTPSHGMGRGADFDLGAEKNMRHGMGSGASFFGKAEDDFEEEEDDYSGMGDEMPEGGEEEFEDDAESFDDEDDGGDDEGGAGPAHPKDRKSTEGAFDQLDPEQKMAVIQEALERGEISEEEAEEAMAELEGGEEVNPQIVSAVEAMIEHEIEGGRMLDFGNGVSAHLPDDADFHHHATEYAKHRAGYLINKDKDPEVADAHKHAANIHASVGNAMHQAGDVDRRRLPGSDGSGKAESHEAAKEQAEAGAQAGPAGPEPEDLPMPGGPLGTNGPGGGPPASGGGGGAKGPPPSGGGQQMEVPSPRDDIAGGEQPGMPDMQRNAPGRDSEIETSKRMTGKLSMLLGKISAPKRVHGGGSHDPTATARHRERSRGAVVTKVNRPDGSGVSVIKNPTGGERTTASRGRGGGSRPAHSSHAGRPGTAGRPTTEPAGSVHDRMQGRMVGKLDQVAAQMFGKQRAVMAPQGPNRVRTMEQFTGVAAHRRHRMDNLNKEDSEQPKFSKPKGPRANKMMGRMVGKLPLPPRPGAPPSRGLVRPTGRPPAVDMDAVRRATTFGNERRAGTERKAPTTNQRKDNKPKNTVRVPETVISARVPGPRIRRPDRSEIQTGGSLEGDTPRPRARRARRAAPRAQAPAQPAAGARTAQRVRQARQPAAAAPAPERPAAASTASSVSRRVLDDIAAGRATSELFRSEKVLLVVPHRKLKKSWPYSW